MTMFLPFLLPITCFCTRQGLSCRAGVVGSNTNLPYIQGKCSLPVIQQGNEQSECTHSWLMASSRHSLAWLTTSTHTIQLLILENVEHCGGEPEQADTRYYVIDR